MSNREPPDLAAIEAFASLLDARSEAGDAPPTPGAVRVPVDLTATARAVRAASGPRNLSRRFADRLEENLMDLAALDRPHSGPPTRRVAATVRRGSHPDAPRSITGGSRRRGIAELLGLTAVIALLFGQVMGVGGNVAFWQDPTPAPVRSDPASGLARVDSGRTGSYPVSGPTGVPVLRWITHDPSTNPTFMQPIAWGDALFLLNPTAGEIISVGVDGRLGPGAVPVATASYVVDGDTIFIASDSEAPGALIAYAYESQAERWRVQTGTSAASLGYDGDHIFMVDTSGMLRAFERADGAEVWTTDLELGIVDPMMQSSPFVENDLSPAVKDGVLVVSTPAGDVRALSATDGSPRWTFDAQEDLIGAPTIGDGTVYVAARGAGSDGAPDIGHVYALDAATGALRWNYPLAAWTMPISKASSVSAEDVLVLTADGTNVYVNGDGETGDAVTALDAETGHVAWSVGFGVTAGSAPVVAGETLHLTRPNAGVYGLNAATGEQRWRLDAGTASLESPVLLGDLLLVTTSEGAVIGLGTGGHAGGSAASPAASRAESNDISGRPPCVATRLRPDPLPTGEPNLSLDFVDRPGNQGQGSVIRADVPIEPVADADVLTSITDTLRAMQACDRPGRERELGGYFTDDYYRRMALYYPDSNHLDLPWFARAPYSLETTALEDLTAPVALEDGRVAILVWHEETREGQLIVFLERGGRWLIDEVVRVTEEPNQPGG